MRNDMMNKFTIILATTLVSSVFAFSAIAETLEITEVSATQNKDGSISGTAVTEISTDDLAITQKVKQAYGDEFPTVLVETKNGIVYLAGTLNTQADIDRAITSAKSLPGVKNVESKLVVGTSPKK